MGAAFVRVREPKPAVIVVANGISTPCALRNISIPILITAMGGHFFIRDNEVHYEVAASKDKDFVVIEGATHGISPCKECETTPGQYSNTVKNFFDYVTTWINARY